MLALALSLLLPATSPAKVISHQENVALHILNAERVLTCYTNDFNDEIGVVTLAASAVDEPAVLNGHGYSIGFEKGGAGACEKVKLLLRDAPDGHPGTGRQLSALASSTLDLDGNKLTETVTVKVFLPQDPDRQLTFQSTAMKFLAP